MKLCRIGSWWWFWVVNILTKNSDLTEVGWLGKSFQKWFKCSSISKYKIFLKVVIPTKTLVLLVERLWSERSRKINLKNRSENLFVELKTVFKIEIVWWELNSARTSFTKDQVTSKNLSYECDVVCQWWCFKQGIHKFHFCSHRHIYKKTRLAISVAEFLVFVLDELDENLLQGDVVLLAVVDVGR